MKSREQIAKQFGLDADPDGRDPLTLDRLMAVQFAGMGHGANGWYPDGEFASDADWVYGVGADIQALEELLQDDFGSVFSLYSEAHTEALGTNISDQTYCFDPDDGDNSPFCRCGMCVPGDVTCIGGEDD